MKQNLRFFLNKLARKLWFRPLIFCLVSIAAALLAHLADNRFISDMIPGIEKSSLEDLLTTISASMLVIAIFAVGSMISAFSAASATATPRSFTLIVADDVSQNALSVYIGSFIFSIVASVALKNGYYGEPGIFTLFVLTLIVFAVVILTFLKWVERISKLGRLGHTIKKVEEAAYEALSQRVQEPFMGGSMMDDIEPTDIPIYSSQIGYVQHIDLVTLQKLAADEKMIIIVNGVPGTFVTRHKPLVYIRLMVDRKLDIDTDIITNAFTIDDGRSFYDDPRFGMIALSEIASRALSPGINDPGTAIAIIGSHVRLFSLLDPGRKPAKTEKVKYDRIMVPALTVADMFDDAFRPIARDGAGNLEVMLRLQKAFIAIAHLDHPETKTLAIRHSRQAFERAELGMVYKKDVEVLKRECLFNDLS